MELQTERKYKKGVCVCVFLSICAVKKLANCCLLGSSFVHTVCSSVCISVCICMPACLHVNVSASYARYFAYVKRVHVSECPAWVSDSGLIRANSGGAS